jgi:dsDNA-specific endonuclease/ATPase MutS2
MRDQELDPEEDEGDAAAEPMELPIDGVLDLHTFAPREVKSLVSDYIDECRARGILEVRIIHGKGTGTLRSIVHGVLARHPQVASFRPAEESMGGWGATVAVLRAAGDGP